MRARPPHPRGSLRGRPLLRRDPGRGLEPQRRQERQHHGPEPPGPRGMHPQGPPRRTRLARRGQLRGVPRHGHCAGGSHRVRRIGPCLRFTRSPPVPNACWVRQGEHRAPGVRGRGGGIDPRRHGPSPPGGSRHAKSGESQPAHRSRGPHRGAHGECQQRTRTRGRGRVFIWLWWIKHPLDSQDQPTRQGSPSNHMRGAKRGGGCDHSHLQAPVL